MIEVFKKMEERDGYSISNHGRVRNDLNNRFVKGSRDKDGYITFNLGRLVIDLKLHRMVAKYFIENPLNKETVNHIDGDKTNNRVDNLEWATRSENSKHAYENGLLKIPNNGRGYNNKMCKLDKEDSLKIKIKYKSGKYTQAELAKLFGVHQVTIGRIVNNKRFI